jgi:hypothetical protein
LCHSRVNANYGSHNATASAAGGPKEYTKFARTSKRSSTSGLKRGRRSVVESSVSESTIDSEEEIAVDGVAANNAKPSEHSGRSIEGAGGSIYNPYSLVITSTYCTSLLAKPSEHSGRSSEGAGSEDSKAVTEEPHHPSLPPWDEHS